MHRMLGLLVLLLSLPAYAMSLPTYAIPWGMVFVVERTVALPHNIKDIAFVEQYYYNDGDPSKWLALGGKQVGQRVLPVREADGKPLTIHAIGGAEINFGIVGRIDLYASPYSDAVTVEVRDGSPTVWYQPDARCRLGFQPKRNLHGEVMARVNGVEGDVYYVDLRNHLVSTKGKCDQYIQ